MIGFDDDYIYSSLFIQYFTQTTVFGSVKQHFLFTVQLTEQFFTWYGTCW